jgi:hypothetical protein
MTGRTVLRWAAGLMALFLLVLWAFLVRFLFQESGQQPAPALIFLPPFFFGLAAWCGVAAIRDEPVLLVLAGGLSLVPTGVFFLFMPGFARWIGILNLGLVIAGVILLRSAGEGEGGVSVTEESTSP